MEKNYLLRTRTMYKAILFDKGNRLAYIGGSTRIANLTGNKETIIVSKVKYPSRITISEDEKLLALKTTNRNIEIYNLNDMSLVGKYKAKGDDGSNILITPDNKYIIDGTWDGQLYLIDMENGKYEYIIQTENMMTDNIIFNQKHGRYEVFRHYKKTDIYEKLVFKYPDISKLKIDNFEISRKVEKKTKTKEEYGLLVKLLYNRHKDAYLAHSYGGLYLCSNNTMQRIAVDCNKFRDVCWSENGEYIFVADTENIKVIRYSDFEVILNYPMKYSYFVKTFYDDKYICIGSFNEGYLYRMEDFLKCK